MPYYDFPNLSDEQKTMYRELSIVENSVLHEAENQRLESERVERAKKDEENEKLLAKFSAQREQELRVEAEKTKKENRERGDADLRRRFFEANPDETESTFQSLLPKMRSDQLLKNMQNNQTTEDLMRATGNYGVM